MIMAIAGMFIMLAIFITTAIVKKEKKMIQYNNLFALLKNVEIKMSIFY